MIKNNVSGLRTVTAKKSSTKNLSSPLSLTSLVDCFSVLVIYLLVATTVGGVELDTPKNIQLPKASESTPLGTSAIIRLEGDRYFLNNKLVEINRLTEALKKLLPQFKSIVIQADRRLEFAKLNPVVLCGLAAGYTKIQFAVTKSEGDQGT